MYSYNLPNFGNSYESYCMIDASMNGSKAKRLVTIENSDLNMMAESYFDIAFASPCQRVFSFQFHAHFTEISFYTARKIMIYFRIGDEGRCKRPYCS